MKQVTVELLNEITRRIVERMYPEKIILFGSYAWGVPEKASDIDLFIVVPHSEEPSYRRARAIYQSLRGVGVPIDVIVQTHDEVERSKGVATSLARNVLEKGKLLYG
ncbi:MAG TPA: nucleotidyltransferase domain-containing protein [Nitrospinota bacterium]|nr:nucleotidyltransferase domain-containing protein [Nitrospinota bacterium]